MQNSQGWGSYQKRTCFIASGIEQSCTNTVLYCERTMRSLHRDTVSNVTKTANLTAYNKMTKVDIPSFITYLPPLMNQLN